jgi:Ca2+/H+ antiporter, TMEM165/GDT1 family
LRRPAPALAQKAMEALVTSFVAAFLAGWGDKSQRVAAMFGESMKRPLLAFAGIALALAASNAVAAIAGLYVATTINLRALTLLTALALLFAGGSGLFLGRPPKPATTRLPLLSAFILILAAEMGDRTQFLTFALAGRFDSAVFAAAGATAGCLAAIAPAFLLGDEFTAKAPLRAIRYAVAALFLVTGFIVAVQALRLA